MIDDKTKQKLLKELEKIGNAYHACKKIGIDPSTYHRWREKSATFKKLSDNALGIGRMNKVDIGEGALMKKVSDGDMNAIKYLLGHNSEVYKPQQGGETVIIHKKIDPVQSTPARTLEDILQEHRQSTFEQGQKLYEEFTMFGGKIPPKPDGSPIGIGELPNYKEYIRDWQKHRDQKINAARFKRGLPSTSITPCHPDDDKFAQEETTSTTPASGEFKTDRVEPIAPEKPEKLTTRENIPDENLTPGERRTIKRQERRLQMPES